MLEEQTGGGLEERERKQRERWGEAGVKEKGIGMQGRKEGKERRREEMKGDEEFKGVCLRGEKGE